MNKKDLPTLIGIAGLAGLVSFLIARTAFSPPAHRTQVPVVQAISSSFPDIKNDPIYQSFLYPGALDPTQPIKIGDTKNSVPFQ